MTGLAGGILTAPKRRDTKALAAALSEVSFGGETSVLLRTERYGTYRLTGTAHKTKVFDGPVLAGVPIAPTGRASTDVLLIESAPTRDVDADADGSDGADSTPVIFPDYMAVPDGAVRTDPWMVKHGDLVHAVFEAHPYGRFAITGHAVVLSGWALMVGGWFLCSNTAPGANIVSVAILPPSMAHAPSPGPAIIEVGDAK